MKVSNVSCGIPIDLVKNVKWGFRKLNNINNSLVSKIPEGEKLPSMVSLKYISLTLKHIFMTMYHELK